MLFDSAREYPQPDPQQRPATFPPPGSKVFDWMLFRAREQKLVEKSETNQDVPMYELAFTSTCENTVLYCTFLFVHYTNKVSSHKFIPFILYLTIEFYWILLYRAIADLGGGDHEAFWNEFGIPVSHLQFHSVCSTFRVELIRTRIGLTSNGSNSNVYWSCSRQTRVSHQWTRCRTLSTTIWTLPTSSPTRARCRTTRCTRTCTATCCYVWLTRSDSRWARLPSRATSSASGTACLPTPPRAHSSTRSRRTATGFRRRGRSSRRSLTQSPPLVRSINFHPQLRMTTSLIFYKRSIGIIKNSREAYTK